MRYHRLRALVGEEGFQSIRSKSVLLAGLGGVGSYCFEALVRSGVGKITIVDHDVYDITNLNRQLGALTETIGRPKVEVSRERAHAIDPDIQIVVKHLRIDKNNVATLFAEPLDFVVDAIDSIEAKVLLIEQASLHQVPIVCSMGFANKFHPEQICLRKLSQTSVDPLAREVRRIVRIRQITADPMVVYSEEVPKKSMDPTVTLGSNAYVPASAGLFLASHVINSFVGGHDL
jgi:tRNA A37 threonylcarbamoyladenosine dehydratase